jgi:hypothetical protein
MVATAPRPPQRRHWQALKEFRENKPKHPIVELEEFLSFWEVSNAELAEICECSVSTVERWFFSKDNPNYRSPTEHHKQLLAEAHYLWWSESNRDRAERLKQMYREKPRNKQL